jgi:hypothetical protein
MTSEIESGKRLEGRVRQSFLHFPCLPMRDLARQSGTCHVGQDAGFVCLNFLQRFYLDRT